jgi:hypothetical protein
MGGVHKGPAQGRTYFVIHVGNGRANGRVRALSSKVYWFRVKGDRFICVDYLDLDGKSDCLRFLQLRLQTDCYRLAVFVVARLE